MFCAAIRQFRGRALLANCFLGLSLPFAGAVAWAQYDEIHLRTLQCPLGTAEVHSSDLRVLVADGPQLTLEERRSSVFRLTADGSRFLALVAGRAEGDFLVLRMTPAGRIEWAASAGGTRLEKPLAIAVTTEGSVVSVGFTTSFFRSSIGRYLGKDDPHGFAMALTGDGERKWAQDFRLGGVTRELYLSAASPTRDGGVILGGLFRERAMGGVLARVNADGAVAWARVYGRGSGYGITDVIPGREGRHIVVAHTRSDSAVLIAEIDEAGTIGRASAITLPGEDAPAQAMAAPDGGVVLTSRSSDRKVVYATHFAADGKPTWSRAYMMDESPDLGAGAGAGDRGYLLVGTSRDSEARGEFFALRIGADGTPIGASVVALRPYFASSEPRETVGVPNTFAVQPTQNGGFALAGSLLVGAREDIDAIGAGRRPDLSRLKLTVMQMDLDTAGSAGACSTQVNVSSEPVQIPERRDFALESEPLDAFGSHIHWGPLVDPLNFKRLKVAP